MTVPRPGSGPGGAPRGRRRAATGSAAGKRADRRTDILVAAETLFAQGGYAAVSVRDIAREAGVPLALVGYYFGRKEELFATIFEHRRDYVTERIERIAAVDGSPANPHAVEELVRAWAEPVITLRQSGAEAFSLLVARTTWDPGPEARSIVERVYDPLAHAFIDAMARALPDRSREAVVWGYEYALGALLMHVADGRVERLSNGRARTGDPSLSEALVRFVAAGFRAIPAAADRHRRARVARPRGAGSRPGSGGPPPSAGG